VLQESSWIDMSLGMFVVKVEREEGVGGGRYGSEKTWRDPGVEEVRRGKMVGLRRRLMGWDWGGCMCRSWILYGRVWYSQHA